MLNIVPSSLKSVNGDIASREMGVNGQRTARRHTRKHNASRRLLLAVEA